MVIKSQRVSLHMVTAWLLSRRLGCGRLERAVRGEAGMSTVEYAIGTVAAAAFAAVLYSVVTGGSVTGALEALVQRALSGNF
ncbi:MAG: DUF4244 domain-containing protein [Pseudonocardiaceae bacterium]